jgi:non-heme chloroperoxidase
VGHSTGGGEVTRYIGRHGTKRVAAAILIGAVPPMLVKSSSNPEGIPIEVFDGLRSGLAKDRSQFWKDFAIMFYGANRPDAKVSQGMLDQFWLWSMQAGLKNVYDSIKAALLIHLAGITTGAPLSFTKNTKNFAGLVWLAFRPTTWTSSGPS